MNPDRMFKALQAATEIGPLMESTFRRFKDWQAAAKVPQRGVRGGGFGEGEPESRAADRRLERQASEYRTELEQIVARMTADAHRVVILTALAHPPRLKTLQSRDMLAAQVAADGWCVNCWRNETLVPIALRPNGQPYYRDRCRPCGSWKGEYGQDRPQSILRLAHEGRRITQQDVDKALGRATG